MRSLVPKSHKWKSLKKKRKSKIEPIKKQHIIYPSETAIVKVSEAKESSTDNLPKIRDRNSSSTPPLFSSFPSDYDDAKNDNSNVIHGRQMTRKSSIVANPLELLLPQLEADLREHQELMARMKQKQNEETGIIGGIVKKIFGNEQNQELKIVQPMMVLPNSEIVIPSTPVLRMQETEEISIEDGICNAEPADDIADIIVFVNKESTEELNCISNDNSSRSGSAPVPIQPKCETEINIDFKNDTKQALKGLVSIPELKDVVQHIVLYESANV